MDVAIHHQYQLVCYHSHVPTAMFDTLVHHAIPSQGDSMPMRDTSTIANQIYKAFVESRRRWTPFEGILYPIR